MTRPTAHQIRNALNVVTRPNESAAKPALRAWAWGELMRARGYRMDTARVDQIRADLQRKGVA